MTGLVSFCKSSRGSMRSRGAVALATFVAALAVTLLASWVHPAVDSAVCSAHGDARAPRDGTSGPSGDHAAGCPLCMPAGAPPPTVFAMESAAACPPTFVRVPVPVARLASLVGAPLPPRGPPPMA